MSDFYITVPSHPRREFLENTPNSFKVRLPNRLPLDGDGWRVGLASATLPDSKVHLDQFRPKKGNHVIQLIYNVHHVLSKDHNGGPWQEKTVEVTFADLENQLHIQNGTQLMKSITDLLDVRRIESIPPNYQIEPTQWVKFSWHPNGDETELIIGPLTDIPIMTRKVTNRIGQVIETALKIEQHFAIMMGWLAPDLQNLGFNLLPEYRTPQDLKKPAPTENYLRTTKWWKVDQGYLELSLDVKWRVVRLDNSLHSLLGNPKRPMLIYSNIGQSVIVGDQVVDILRQLIYEQTGRGNVYFEPYKIQYHPIRNKDLEIIEIQIAEGNNNK